MGSSLPMNRSDGNKLKPLKYVNRYWYCGIVLTICIVYYVCIIII